MVLEGSREIACCKCTCKHNRVARKSRGSMDEQLHKFNSCTCSRATYKLLQSAAKDQAGAIFTENGAAVDTVKRQRQLDDQHEQSRVLRPGSPARSARMGAFSRTNYHAWCTGA